MLGADVFRDTVIALVRDWGTAVEISASKEALAHLLAEQGTMYDRVPVFGNAGYLGDQLLLLMTSVVSLAISALGEREEAFAIHAQKLLRRTSFQAIHWANITHERVTIATVRH